MVVRKNVKTSEKRGIGIAGEATVTSKAYRTMAAKTMVAATVVIAALCWTPQEPQAADDVIADFGSSVGLWMLLNNTAPWVRLTGLSPDEIGHIGDIDGN